MAAAFVPAAAAAAAAAATTAARNVRLDAFVVVRHLQLFAGVVRARNAHHLGGARQRLLGRRRVGAGWKQKGSGGVRARIHGDG